MTRTSAECIMMRMENWMVIGTSLQETQKAGHVGTGHLVPPNSPSSLIHVPPFPPCMQFLCKEYVIVGLICFTSPFSPWLSLLSLSFFWGGMNKCAWTLYTRPHVCRCKHVVCVCTWTHILVEGRGWRQMSSLRTFYPYLEQSLTRIHTLPIHQLLVTTLLWQCQASTSASWVLELQCPATPTWQLSGDRN